MTVLAGLLAALLAQDAPVLKTRRLELRVRDTLALARFDYTVENSTALPLGGEIGFSVPEGAAVVEAELAKNVSSKDRVSKLLPAAAASRVFADAVREIGEADVARRASDPAGAGGIGGLLGVAANGLPLGDPAILELVDGSSYRLRFFPVMPRDDQKASFTFAVEAVPADGLRELRIPLSHETRFAPGKDAAVSLRIAFATAVEDVSSPTHAVRRDARGGYEAEPGTSTELVLRYRPKGRIAPPGADEWGRAHLALRRPRDLAVTRESSLLVIDRAELKRRLGR